MWSVLVKLGIKILYHVVPFDFFRFCKGSDSGARSGGRFKGFEFLDEAVGGRAAREEAGVVEVDGNFAASSCSKGPSSSISEELGSSDMSPRRHFKP